ncbi:hypothetical protein B0H14DRAFT_3136886 [Mycena olivaceomarginata]|nr:hypothetical protein B0H14DRAFT_3136886 [Mycena olivaceomarginata]
MYCNESTRTSDGAETLKTDKSPIGLGISCRRSWLTYRTCAVTAASRAGLPTIISGPFVGAALPRLPGGHPLVHSCRLKSISSRLKHQAHCLKSKSVASSSKSIASSFKFDSSFKTTSFNVLGTSQYPVYIEDSGPKFWDSLNADLHNRASGNARKLNNTPSDIVDEVQHKVDATISAAATDKAATIPAVATEMGDPDED